MSSDKAFDCICGVRADSDGNKAIWIESCKTGKRLEVPGGWWAELPDRLVSRVVQTRSEGDKVATFTLAELLAFSALAERVTKHLAKRYPAGPSTTSRLGPKHR